MVLTYSSLSPCFESSPILSSYGPENILPMSFCSTIRLQPVVELPIILRELGFFSLKTVVNKSDSFTRNV